MYADKSQNRRVLMVEDDVLFAWSAAMELTTAGFDVTTIDTGDVPGFIDRVRQSDIVLLDVSLPGISGFNLAHEIRRDPMACSVPVVMLTALSPVDYHTHALECGADDVMLKPPNWPDLIARLNTLLWRTAVAG